MTEGRLLDTNSATTFFNAAAGHAGLRAQLAEIPDDLLFICAPTIGEIEFGLESVADRDRGDRGWKAAVRSDMAKWGAPLALDRHTAVEYGRIKAELYRRHAGKERQRNYRSKRPEMLRDPITSAELGITENDLWIVSVAVQHRLRFVTADRATGMRRVLEVASYLAWTDFWLVKT
jgi:predicted nucleic acid-binding protein